MELCYPLSIYDNRTLPKRFDKPVFVWDIDKTYLVTHFSSLRGIFRIPIEFAVDKRAIPGMPEVLHGLRRGPGSKFICAPLYFVTAGPPQLQKVLEQRMLLDGVEHDGITFKDWVKTLKQRRPGRLRDQVGFKLCALLAGRQRRPLAKEYLFGDDVENDADAFNLYARLIQGSLSTGEAEEEMANAGVKKDDRNCVFSLLDRLPRKRGSVKRIFIYLERKTPPERFQHFGKLVVPVKSSFQLSLALYKLRLVDVETVHQSRNAIFPKSDSSQSDISEQIADAIKRNLITAQKAGTIKLT